MDPEGTEDRNGEDLVLGVHPAPGEHRVSDDALGAVRGGGERHIRLAGEGVVLLECLHEQPDAFLRTEGEVADGHDLRELVRPLGPDLHVGRGHERIPFRAGPTQRREANRASSPARSSLTRAVMRVPSSSCEDASSSPSSWMRETRCPSR